MYLLEYRDREIPLAAGNTFRIPENVRIIGTMNTADRSIAQIDHALRRRFAFIELRPNYNVLRQYYLKTGYAVEDLIKIIQELNQAIANKNYEIGVSFFLTDNLRDDIQDIWQMEIEPYLEEYFFDKPDKVDENGNYTFSQYFNFTQPSKEIIAEFGYSYQRDKLNLAQYQGYIAYLDFLKGYLERNIRLVNPTVEIAIREFLIAPIIAEVGYYTASEVYSEYTLNLDNLLEGTLDYYLKKNHCLLVIEAKQADLRRGFTQLAV